MAEQETKTLEQPATQASDTPEEPATPRGSAADAEQLKDQEFLNRLNKVLTADAIGMLVASSPFAKSTQEQLKVQAEELAKQTQATTSIHRDLTTTMQNVGALLEGVNILRDHATGGAPSGDGKNQPGAQVGTEGIPVGSAQAGPVPRIQLAEQTQIPTGENAELKYWVNELKGLLTRGDTMQQQTAQPETDQVMAMMKTMAGAFKDMFSTVAGVIKEVRMVEQGMGGPATSAPAEARVPVGSVHE